jgi:hypothetical protein
MQQGRKALVANKIVLKSKDLTAIALTCRTSRDFHEVLRAGGPYEKRAGHSDPGEEAAVCYMPS